MRSVAVALLFVIFQSGYLAYAQSTREVLGRVTDSETGRPVADVTISVGDQGTTTNQSGDYQLVGVPADTQVTITATAQGYETVSRNITVSSTGVVPVQDFALQPITAGTIFGAITDSSTGQPIEGATISASGVSALSDSAGNYELINVPAGEGIAVTASTAGYESAFQTVDLEAAQRVGVSLALTPVVTTATVSGTVRDSSDGSALRGAQVSTASSSTTTDASGNFVLSQLQPGALSVRVSAPGFISHTESLSLGAGETARLIVFLRQVVPASSVQGLVKNRADGRPVSGALVSSGSVSTNTNDQGGYTLTNLNGAIATVTVQAEGLEPDSRVVELRPGRANNLNFELRPIADRLMILWAGFGYTPLTFTSEDGGTISIEAEVVGASGDASVEVLYQVVSPFGNQVEVSLGSMVRQEGTDLYRMVLPDLPPGSLPPGPNEIPGFAIRASDSSGRVAHFPALDVPGEAPQLLESPRGGSNEPMRPMITMAGFGLSPLTYSLAEGGEVTIRAHVLGGMPPIRVEGFFSAQNPFGYEVNVPLGRFLDQDGDRVYELSLSGLDRSSLRAGANLIFGLNISATDARSMTAAWPTLDVPGAPEGSPQEIGLPPRLPSGVRDLPRPIILMAGFGDSPASISAAEGGTIVIWAQVAGLPEGAVVEATSSLPSFQSARMSDPDGDGVYQLTIDSIAPGSIPEGPYVFPGFAIRVRDPSGRVLAYWPELEVPQTQPSR